MTAAELATALAGHQGNNRWWSCRCPVCQREGKLGLRDGKDGLAVNCFRGCGRSEILAELERRGLHDPANPDLAPEISPEEQRQRQEAEEANRQARIARARWLWQEETHPAGGVVQVYLWSRLLFLDPIPDVIRFHPSLRHKESGESRPAMICRIDRGGNGESIGVHATYLAIDGSSKATIDPQRRTIGAIAGGAVQLGQPQPDQWLVVGEGVESTLSMALALKAPGWAALSAGGIKRLILPPAAKMVLIAADNDAKGTGQRAANSAAARWCAEGKRVKVVMPPRPGTDWNDVLLAGRIDGRHDHAAQRK
jgi:phage/plasmid primase-like uncharacterized protein